MIERAKGVEIAKKALKDGIRIEWETDISKLANLANANRYKGLKLQIKDMSLDVFPPSRDMELFQHPGNEMTHDEASIAHTCYLVSQGVKIVPPIRINRWVMADGEPKEKGSTHAHYFDGSHRVCLSRLLGYKSIPVIYADILDGYSFSVDLWDFDFQKTQIIATKKDGGDKMVVKTGDEVVISLSNTGKIWIDYCGTARLLT